MWNALFRMFALKSRSTSIFVSASVGELIIITDQTYVLVLTLIFNPILIRRLKENSKLMMSPQKAKWKGWEWTKFKGGNEAAPPRMLARVSWDTLTAPMTHWKLIRKHSSLMKQSLAKVKQKSFGNCVGTVPWRWFLSTLARFVQYWMIIGPILGIFIHKFPILDQCWSNSGPM